MGQARLSANKSCLKEISVFNKMAFKINMPYVTSHFVKQLISSNFYFILILLHINLFVEVAMRKLIF